MDARLDVRLLFTDVQMPGAIDGLELARQVHLRWPDVLIVITSGGRRPERAEIADDGSFVPKPYCDGDLMAQVNDQLSRSKH